MKNQLTSNFFDGRDQLLLKYRDKKTNNKNGLEGPLFQDMETISQI